MRSSTQISYIRRFLILVVLIGAFGFILAFVDAWHEKSDAEQFMKSLSTIKVGSSTKSDVIVVNKPFVRYADSLLTSERAPEDDGVSYTFRNRIMAFLHLAPPKFVYAAIEFRDGIVTQKSVNFYQEPRFGVIVQEATASEVPPAMSANSRQVHTIIYGPKSTVIRIQDDTSVPLSRRQLDWQIDISCLITPTACKDVRLLLPGVFPK